MDTLEEMSIDELAERVGGRANGLKVLDVRDETEWVTGHIPGARNLSAGALAQGAEANLDESAPVAVICGTGYRSAVAASLLKGRGLKQVIAIPGGMAAWTQAGFPTA